MLTEGTGHDGEGELPPGLRDLEGPRAFELTLNFQGRLEPEQLAEVDESMRGSAYLEVRRSEIIWANKGAGGAGQALFAELIQIGGQMAPGLLTAGVLAGFAKVYRATRKFAVFPRLKVALLRRPPVTYEFTVPGPEAPLGMDDPDFATALEQLPPDYEETTTETVKRWRDGRWQEIVTVTRTRRGGPDDPTPDEPS